MTLSPIVDLFNSLILNHNVLTVVILYFYKIKINAGQGGRQHILDGSN